MSTTNFGLTIAQRLAPSLERAYDLMDAVAQGLRVALPGIVQSFNAITQTVDVLVATAEYVQRNLNGPGTLEGAPTPINVVRQPLPLPLLSAVPVCIIGSGGWHLTTPIVAGDECILLFADTALDIWLQNGCPNNLPVAPCSARRHDLSDAMAIFGVRSQPKALTGYSTTSAQLRSDDGSVVIDLATGQITFTATMTLVHGTFQVDGAFGCNSQAPQTPAASGGAVAVTAPVNVGPWGYSTALQAAEIVTLVNNIRTALIACGIMS
jgi:hypothetical protein